MTSNVGEYKTLLDALAAPEAAILVHDKVECDRNGNSRARQTVYASNGECLYTDGRERSYWYRTENARYAFEKRGGLVLSP